MRRYASCMCVCVCVCVCALCARGSSKEIVVNYNQPNQENTTYKLSVETKENIVLALNEKAKQNYVN